MTFMVVPGRADGHGLTWWVYCSDGEPESFEVYSAVGEESSEETESPNWVGPMTVQTLVTGAPLAARSIAKHFWLVGMTELSPDTLYRLVVRCGETTRKQYSRTLPASFRCGERFVMAFASCFNLANDKKGRVRYFPPRRDLLPSHVHLRVSLGDQIYMDFDESSGYLERDPPHVVNKYLRQWRRADWLHYLGRAPNLTLVDDHEFWNNYPEFAIQLSQNVGSLLNDFVDWVDGWDGEEEVQNWSGDWFESIVAGGDPLFDVEEFHRGVSLFQSALNVPARSVVASPAGDPGYWQEELIEKKRWRTFSFETDSPELPVRIFGLDTRSFREKVPLWGSARFARESHMDQLQEWMENLDRPGVLCVSQNLVCKPAWGISGSVWTDQQLADFPDQFGRIWDLLRACRHSVLIVSGDVHWSTLRSIAFAPDEKPRHYELVTTALSRIRERPQVSTDSHGEVDWKGVNGAKQAYWKKMFRAQSKQTYSTVEFSDGPRPGVRARVTPWRICSYGTRPYYDYPFEPTSNMPQWVAFEQG